MPGMVNRPSDCVTASYVVPEGTCTATMLAPGMTAPCASLTTPVTAAVVTPCAARGLADIASARSAPIAHTRRDHFTCFIANSCGRDCSKKTTRFYSGRCNEGTTKKAVRHAPDGLDPTVRFCRSG